MTKIDFDKTWRSETNIFSDLIAETEAVDYFSSSQGNL